MLMFMSVMWLQLPPEDVKDFLEQMSVPRLNRGWEFLLPSDHDFVRKHPDVAQRQHMLWLGIQSKYEVASLKWIVCCISREVESFNHLMLFQHHIFFILWCTTGLFWSSKCSKWHRHWTCVVCVKLRHIVASLTSFMRPVPSELPCQSSRHR